MKKTKVINSDISRVIAQMGHFDKLSIGDAGMPVPRTIPHTEMKQELNNCHAFIRTGEMTPYANILLESNVVF